MVLWWHLIEMTIEGVYLSEVGEKVWWVNTLSGSNGSAQAPLLQGWSSTLSFDHVHQKWVWGHCRGSWEFMSSPKAAASWCQWALCECDLPWEEAVCVREGSLAMIWAASPQGLPPASLRAQFIASGGGKFTPSVLCRLEACHYTSKNSLPSLCGLGNPASAKHPGIPENGQFVLSHSPVSHTWKYHGSVLNIPPSYSHGRSGRASDHHM